MNLRTGTGPSPTHALSSKDEPETVELSAPSMATTSVDGTAIKVLCAGAMSRIVRELADAFERSTGIKISTEFTRSGLVRSRVRGGEAVDVAVTTRAAIEELAGQMQVLPDSVAAVARSGIGVAIQAGRRKPDIGSAESFKRLLRHAQSIAYADPATGSPSGNYLVRLFDRLGMASELQSKTRLIGADDGHAVVVCDAVASGEAEIGIQQIAEIIPVVGVELVGPLPPDLQHMTAFCAAVAARAGNAETARQLVGFITSEAARAVIVANGMEPG
jgi:molybdate transport system substrate-binding protein